MKKIVQICFFALLSWSLSASDQQSMDEFMKRLPKQDQEKLKELSEVLAINATVNKFKDDNIKSPEKTYTQFFKSLVGIKWERMRKESNFAPIFWSDFFTGCSLMNGPYNRHHAVTALYNPWWDAILLFRLDAEKDGPQWKISSFELKSGEAFRGEKSGNIPSIETVIASRGQQAVVWMRLIKSTREAFQKVFSEYKTPEDCRFSNTFSPNSTLPVQLRAAARMRLHQEILKNKGVTVEMASFLQLLHGIKAEKMSSILKGDDLQTFAYFASLPVGFRKTMTYYGYWGTEEKRLYLYISRMNPNIICLLYIHAGVQVNFEMFDLNDSEKYLDAIEQSGKAVKK